MDNDQGVIVHFASRRDAESAFNRGTNYHGQLMKIDWYEEAHSPAPAAGGGGGSGHEEEGDYGELFSPLRLQISRFLSGNHEELSRAEDQQIQPEG